MAIHHDDLIISAYILLLLAFIVIAIRKLCQAHRKGPTPVSRLIDREMRKIDKGDRESGCQVARWPESELDEIRKTEVMVKHPPTPKTIIGSLHGTMEDETRLQKFEEDMARLRIGYFDRQDRINDSGIWGAPLTKEQMERLEKLNWSQVGDRFKAQAQKLQNRIGSDNDIDHTNTASPAPGTEALLSGEAESLYDAYRQAVGANLVLLPDQQLQIDREGDRYRWRLVKRGGEVELPPVPATYCIGVDPYTKDENLSSMTVWKSRGGGIVERFTPVTSEDWKKVAQLYQGEIANMQMEIDRLKEPKVHLPAIADPNDKPQAKMARETQEFHYPLTDPAKRNTKPPMYGVFPLIKPNNDMSEGSHYGQGVIDERNKTKEFIPVTEDEMKEFREISTRQLNEEIAGFNKFKAIDTGKISDGFHTFDELYEMRLALTVAWLKRMNIEGTRVHKEMADKRGDHYNVLYTTSVWRSRLHSDGTMFDDYFIVGYGVNPGEFITFHYPLTEWDTFNFCHTWEKAPEWDGHTDKDVIQRLKSL